MTDYKNGNDYRSAYSPFDNSSFGSDQSSADATQVWLMGDGTLDSYSNMIRNQVKPTDQNWTKMQLNSMQSNDIQNVSIPGLS